MTDIKDEILEKLEEGMSLLAICRAEGMPSARTVQRWQKEDEAFNVAVTHAREAGFLLRAERVVERAAIAEDAAKGRLELDAERWFLGKLSNAFSDKQKLEHSGVLKTEVVKRVIYDPRNPDGEDIHPAS